MPPTELPHDIQTHLLEFLDFRSLLNLCSTNRYFFNLPTRGFSQKSLLPFERKFKPYQQYPLFEEYMPLMVCNEDPSVRVDPLYPVYTCLKRRYFF